MNKAQVFVSLAVMAISLCGAVKLAENIINPLESATKPLATLTVGEHLVKFGCSEGKCYKDCGTPNKGIQKYF